MKLVWRGKYYKESQLEQVNLPERAVQFKEPDTPLKLNLATIPFCIILVIAVILAIIIKRQLGLLNYIPDVLSYTGFILAIFMIIPHELIHAISFPKEAEVSMWYSLRNVMAFVYSTHPMSRSRFIVMSLMPSIVFGFIPLLLWIVIPGTDILINFAAYSLLFGAGDFMNIYNAWRQMPVVAVTQLSGFHSYWYIPENPKKEQFNT